MHPNHHDHGHEGHHGLVFVTTSDVAELRELGVTLAQMHNDLQAAMKRARHAAGMIGVHSKAAASDVEGGAQFAVTANGADVAKLHAELRMCAPHFSSGSCEMGKH